MKSWQAITTGALSTLFLIALIGVVTATITNNGNGTTTFSLTLPNADATRVATAFAATYHYESTLYDPETEQYVPNPQTKGQFTEVQIRKYIKEVVVAYELDEAKKAVQTPISPTVN